MRTGNLRRGIQTTPAQLMGSRARGAIGVKGVSYALKVHRRIPYLGRALVRVQPQAVDIFRQHVIREAAADGLLLKGRRRR